MGRVRKPIVPDGPIRAFFDRLHTLHADAGQPSMRELQRRTRSRQRPTGINPTTIHDALAGPRLASWDTVLAIVGQLGGDADEFATLWRAGRAAEMGMPAPERAGRSTRRQQPADRPTPRELPPDVTPFVGRAAQLAELDGLLDGPGSAVAIGALCGTAGVGKTALAVHWAHRVADRFPDGHLYIDLRGYDPEPPVPPADALASFLRAMRVPKASVPRGVAECAAWYRSLLAGRRMLVVLDNARGADHVRPLLPGTPSCLVLITSRDSLAGLVARHGARRVNLDPLCGTGATELMRALLGAWTDAEPPAVRALVERCERLPLSLRIAAELAAASTGTTVADLARELADDRRLLDLFDAGDDPRTALRAVFSWSYRQLPDPAARLFRLLGLRRAHTGREVDALTVAALAGIGLDDALRLSDLLARAHLLDRVGPDTFAMNGLLAAYAAELAAVHDTEADRRAALARAFGHQGPPRPRTYAPWRGTAPGASAPLADPRLARG
jgi:hypothetical protein